MTSATRNNKVPLTTGPIIRPSANYDHFFTVLHFPLYKSMVVGSNNATVPLLRITTTFSGPNDIFIAVLRSTYETSCINPPPTNYTVLHHQLNPFTTLVSRGANKSRCETDYI